MDSTLISVVFDYFYMSPPHLPPLVVSYHHNIFFQIVNDMYTKFDLNCCRRYKVQNILTHTSILYIYRRWISLGSLCRLTSVIIRVLVLLKIPCLQVYIYRYIDRDSKHIEWLCFYLLLFFVFVFLFFFEIPNRFFLGNIDKQIIAFVCSLSRSVGQKIIIYCLLIYSSSNLKGKGIFMTAIKLDKKLTTKTSISSSIFFIQKKARNCFYEWSWEKMNKKLNKSETNRDIKTPFSHS